MKKEIGICHLCGDPVYIDKKGKIIGGFHEILRDWFYHNICIKKNKGNY